MLEVIFHFEVELFHSYVVDLFRVAVSKINLSSGIGDQSVLLIDQVLYLVLIVLDAEVV